jgi:predicted acyl esterase
VSHRALDPELSLPYRPYHPHDDKQPLTPGEIYEVDVEIWPTCIVIPAGYTLGLSVRGTDYMYPHLEGDQPRLSNFANALTGVGPFLHDDPRDRPREVYGGQVTIHTGGEHRSWLYAPIVPKV